MLWSKIKAPDARFLASGALFLLQAVALITAGGSAAFSISVARGIIRTAATTWVIVWVFHIALIVGSNVFHHLAVAVVTGNFPPFFLLSSF